MSRLPEFSPGEYQPDAMLGSVSPLVPASLSRMLRPRDLWKEWAGALKNPDDDGFMYVMQDIWLLELEKDPVACMWRRLVVGGYTLADVLESFAKAQLYQAANFIAVNVLAGDPHVAMSHDVESTSAALTPNSLATVQQELRHHYDRKYSHVTPVPWNQHFIVELNKLYTEIKVIPVPKGQRGTLQTGASPGTESLTIDEVLSRSVSGSRSGSRILIEGDAGMGKSTMVQKIALDWATGVTQTEAASSGDEQQAPFDLVLVIEGQSINSSSITEVLGSKVLPPSVSGELQEVLSDVEQQKRALVVIDGFDEIQNGNEKLLPLLSGAELSRCTVVVTSRTNHAAALSRHFSETFLIPGLEVAAQTQFIKNYSEQTDSSFEEIQAALHGGHHPHLDRNTQLISLVQNPMYLLYLCILLEDGYGQLPETRTEIYHTLVQLVVDKTAERLELDPDKANSAFLKICKVAFEGMIENKMEFEEKELPRKDEIFNLGLQFGFMMQKMSRSRLAPRKQFSFCHKTFQEYLAANHLNNMEEEEKLALLKKSDPNWRMVLMFLCGMLKGEDKELDKLYRNVICMDLKSTLSLATSVVSSGSTHQKFHLGLECLSESGIFETFQDLSRDIVPHCFHLLWTYDCHYCVKGFEVANQITLHHQPDLIVYGPEIVPINHCKDTLERLLETCKNNQSLVLSNIMSVNSLVEIIQTVFNFGHDLTHLYIYMIPVPHNSKPILDYSTEEIEAALQRLTKLKSLVFQGTSSVFVQGFDTTQLEVEVKHITEKLMELIPGLQTLILNTLILNTSSVDLMESNLNNCKNLRKIHLWNIRLLDTDLLRILETLLDSRILVSLGLHNCAKFTKEETRTKLLQTIGIILEHNKMKSLTLLSLNLKAEDITSFLEPFSRLKNVAHLQIGGTVFSAENQIKVIAAVGKLKLLNVLQLQDFSFVGADLSALADSTKSLEFLNKLEVRYSNLGSHPEFEELSTALSTRNHLEAVVLEDCGITDKDKVALGHLFQISNLKNLSLMQNSIGSTLETVDYVIGGISQCGELQNLQLFLESFSLEIANLLVKSLSTNKKLSTLRITTKPGIEMIQIGMDKLWKMFKDALPSLKNANFGMALPGSPFRTSETDHELWKRECVDLD